jgi:hemolysin activation/secretion protein
VFTAVYTTGPLIADSRVSFAYLHSSSTVPAAGTLGVLGKGDIYGSHITWPLLSTEATSQTILFGADYKHFFQDIAASPTESLHTPVNYMNWSLGHQGVWRGETRVWSAFTSINFGIRGVVNEADDFENARFLARPNYMYLREDASVVQKLGNWSVRLRITGQYTDEPLLAYEQYSIAGSDGVRGYLESEQLGDQAVKGTLQVESPPAHFGRFGGGTLFVFFDAGKMWVIDALPDTPDHASLRSIGAGFALNAPFGLTGLLTWAYPLAESVGTPAHDSRVLFLVRGAF